MTKEQIKTEQTGRSMVEMLGVLAVIGVLSVTGVAGYQRAMTKHRANELVNEVSKRAVVVATQISAGKTASISEFNNTNIAGLGVGFDSTIGRDGDKLFTIKTNGNIAKEICQQVYNAIGDKTAVRLLQSGTTDVTSADKCAASAPLSFTYNNELSSEGLGYDGHFDPDDGTKCAEGYYPAGKCNLQCTGNTKVNVAGTGCDCKTGYKGTDCNECNTGYGKNTDNQCVTCPGNSANNGDTTQETNITGCYCPSGEIWDATLNSNQGGCKKLICENRGACNADPYENGVITAACCKASNSDYRYVESNGTGYCCEYYGYDAVACTATELCCTTAPESENLEWISGRCCDFSSGYSYQTPNTYIDIYDKAGAYNQNTGEEDRTCCSSSKVDNDTNPYCCEINGYMWDVNLDTCCWYGYARTGSSSYNEGCCFFKKDGESGSPYESSKDCCLLNSNAEWKPGSKDVLVGNDYGSCCVGTWKQKGNQYYCCSKTRSGYSGIDADHWEETEDTNCV